MFGAGTEIICQSRGSPFPNISWTKADGTPIATIPGLRQVGAINISDPDPTNICFFFQKVMSSESQGKGAG